MDALVIAGLGNPGTEYSRTRHNLGYDVLDLVATRLGATFRTRARALHATGMYAGRAVVLIKPTTYMNLSGQAVAPFMRRNGIVPASLLVVHDDLDLAAGRLRVRRGGSAGGHRGVQSIIGALGTADFSRLKIGIGRPPIGMDPVEYVLLRPALAEREQLDAVAALAADACLAWIAQGIEAAMNQFNGTEQACGPQPGPPPTGSRI